MRRALAVSLPLLLLPLLSLAAVPQPAAAPSVELTVAANADGTLAVTFHNATAGPCILNLGVDLGNGHSFRPTNLSLLITPKSGPARELSCKGFAVGGRVDDFLIPLPPGASYTLPIAFTDFISKTNGIPTTPQQPPIPGESLQVRFTPTDASHTNTLPKTLWKTPLLSASLPVPAAK